MTETKANGGFQAVSRRVGYYVSLTDYGVEWLKQHRPGVYACWNRGRPPVRYAAQGVVRLRIDFPPLWAANVPVDCAGDFDRSFEGDAPCVVIDCPPELAGLFLDIEPEEAVLLSAYEHWLDSRKPSDGGAR